MLREEAGFAKADTVARFLKDKEMQEAARGGVILVDEASQLGTRDMLRVFEMAEAVGARVLACRRQAADSKRHGGRTAQAAGGKGGASRGGGNEDPATAGELHVGSEGTLRGPDRGGDRGA